MKNNIDDTQGPRVQKILLGFWVEQSLGIQLKDAAWRQRQSLSELLREYCRAGLRLEEQINDHRHGHKQNYELFDTFENQAPTEED